MNQNNINICSEIGRLRAVILHRPGKELERIVPAMLQEVLFEDIPWLKRMQEEHDAFAAVLKERGVKVFYVEELLKEIVKDPAVRESLITDVMAYNPSSGYAIDAFLKEYLQAMPPEKLVEALIAGVLQKELDTDKRQKVLSDYLYGKEPYSFYMKPLPNLYFMRDPAVAIGDGMAISAMATEVRRRESLYMHYIYHYHPLFTQSGSRTFYDYNAFFSVEGGDILVLSDKTVAVGCSERTSVQGAELLAKRLFRELPAVESVLAVKIPNNRAFMHLDTVFTMIDYDKFTVYPGILDAVETVIIKRGAGDTLAYTYCEHLKDALKTVLGLPALKLIESGGGNPVAAAREQWNDSTNTLAIAPGVVVAYGRNERSNTVLSDNGIEVIAIEASELVRGRGGPRCMTMPIARDDV